MNLSELSEADLRINLAGGLLIISGTIALTSFFLGILVNKLCLTGFYHGVIEYYIPACAAFHLIIGLLSLLGGIMALKRRKYNITFICTLASIPITFILGLAALVLIFFSMGDFED